MSIMYLAGSETLLSKIDQMAQLVLANPTITAKELAQKMGYAEQKSVYYWLEKAGYRGLKDFKQSVLSGCFQFARLPDAQLAKDAPRPAIPLYTGDKLRRVDCSELLDAHLGPGSFAVQLQGGGSGDILIIDPEALCTQGSIVLVSTGDKASQARVYYMAGKSPIYVDLNNPNLLLSPDFVIGKVVFVVKRAI